MKLYYKILLALLSVLVGCAEMSKEEPYVPLVKLPVKSSKVEVIDSITEKYRQKRFLIDSLHSEVDKALEEI